LDLKFSENKTIPFPRSGWSVRKTNGGTSDKAGG